MERGRRGLKRSGGAWAWYAFAALSAAGLVLVALNRGGDWSGVARGPADDGLAAAQQAVNAPVDVVRGVTRGVSEHVRLHQENQRLREENERLRRWYDLALAMRDKMERYEVLLALNPDAAADAVTARVVQEMRGPFVHGRLINAGREDGVAQGQAVLADRGLAGRIISVGRSAARVLLLSDVNSRVPVMADRNDARAILIGDNTDRPRLSFRRASHGLREGDRIVTSGDAGRLPRGLPVGVAYIDARGVWRARLFADDAPLDYVRVIRLPRGPSGDDADAPPTPSSEPAVEDRNDRPPSATGADRAEGAPVETPTPRGPVRAGLAVSPNTADAGAEQP